VMELTSGLGFKLLHCRHFLSPGVCEHGAEQVLNAAGYQPWKDVRLVMVHALVNPHALSRSDLVTCSL